MPHLQDVAGPVVNAAKMETSAKDLGTVKQSQKAAFQIEDIDVVFAESMLTMRC